ncbi:hypothetical protein NM208_g11067 [Fusarium decemcellulare]|uniref:Uncharacterized protein n=1 Tax=Fusarium decemcellulare TaxID=57161 RepID=A0ACC1RVM4_9HYPO|nr:hypothetical protein NM208_g11067 [Fusarium decemcellulare]
MFRRHWSGLPKDASFPSDLASLGFFVNDQGEIRSIDNPDCYFQFFSSRNPRFNERQRFHFNGAVGKVIHDRLEGEGLVKLPLGAEQSLTEKHCPIFITPSVARTSRIVIVFGEPIQNVGFLAGRIINGPGGITKGSVISLVQALAKQTASANDNTAPGVVLANMGERYWWPDGKRALTTEDSTDTPLPSMVHAGCKYVAELNDIPGSENPLAHMETIFKRVISVNREAKIDIIAIGQSCEFVLKFFEERLNWDRWGHRLGGMLFLGAVYKTDNLANQDFKDFLANRTRGYLISSEPLDTPLAMPRGNPSLSIEPMGCPCVSSGEPQYTELIAIKAMKSALDYLQEVALTPGFINPPMAVAERRPTDFTDEDWVNLPEENKPGVTTHAADEMKKQIKEIRRWRKFEETGQAPDFDSDDDSDEVEEVPRNLGKPDWREGEDW